MTQEDLKSLRPFWPKGGLRMLDEEAYQTTASFTHQVYGGQETMATLMTGTTPNHHSIMSDEYFDRKSYNTGTNPIQPILYDNRFAGIGTTLQLSPLSIAATTITDEWRMVYGPESHIYAIGLQPEATILMAGHAANGCCWLSETNQKWATSSFYSRGLPFVADTMNINNRIKDLAALEWQPSMDINAYPLPIATSNKKPFIYSNSNVMLNSPIANTLVVDLALALQSNQQIGLDNTPDLLMLQLNTLSPNAESDMITSIEQTDLYMGINQDLGRLFTLLNQRIGRENYQVLLMGRPVKGYSKETMRKANMPLYHLNTDRVAALVGAYLIAMNGTDKWVLGGHGPFIYLNRLLIEKKGLSLETFQRLVANFIMEFEGIQIAYPIHEAVISEDRASVFRKHAGDVYFRLQDNWILDSDEENTFDHVIQSEPIIPVLFWSQNAHLLPENKKIDATEVKSLISPME